MANKNKTNRNNYDNNGYQPPRKRARISNTNIQIIQLILHKYAHIKIWNKYEIIYVNVYIYRDGIVQHVLVENGDMDATNAIYAKHLELSEIIKYPDVSPVQLPWYWW